MGKIGLKTKEYYSIADLAWLYMVHYNVAVRLTHVEYGIAPDVQISTRVGVDKNRAIEFGVDSKRLYSDGTRNPDAPSSAVGRKMAGQWQKTPEVFLTAREAGALVGVSKDDVWVMARLGEFVTPDVSIGGELFGYSMERVQRDYGVPTGRVPNPTTGVFQDGLLDPPESSRSITAGLMSFTEAAKVAGVKPFGLAQLVWGRGMAGLGDWSRQVGFVPPVEVVAEGAAGFDPGQVGLWCRQSGRARRAQAAAV